ncbi:MAG: circadian clock protein KaiC [Pseudomonadota bacterium]|nr:circadian clock protein KaiC [Pseudomonadota bacterium]
MKQNDPTTKETGKASTGIAGLDSVLNGGLARSRTFLLEGIPGTGKTTIALEFLREGARAKERGLYITLSETEEELRATADSHGWQLNGVDIFELLPPENLLSDDQQQSLLYSSDLELGELTRQIFAEFERVSPDRVVLDSLSEIRLLAQSSLRYRRQILAMKHYFAKRNTTVLLLDDLTTEASDKSVHSVAHGVIALEELAPNFGAERRRLRVLKYRANRFRGGYHDFVIETGGVCVFPRLVASEHGVEFRRDTLPSLSPELNALLGGGVERGSSVLVMGPAGAGKSLLALSFIVSAAARGERSAMFIFDEERGLLVQRSKGLGIDIESLEKSGMLTLIQVDAAQLTPGEFSELVCRCIERDCAKNILLDSLNGYQASMPEERALTLHVHELLQYSNRMGATTFMTVAQHGLLGEMKAPIDLTYLADTVILLRFFEAEGEVRRAISIVKKRTSAHEKTIREYRMDSHGLTLGEPLSNFHGVLRGTPTLLGGQPRLRRRKP